MLMIAHIINPVIISDMSDLYAAQPVTFESMRLAQEFAAGSVDVELYSAQFREDSEFVPAWIKRTQDLERSVLSVGNFQEQRKLPLIKDIVQRLYEASHADYFIYTNVDIGLMPHFYLAVAQLIQSGLDAMVINRRTIAKHPADPSVMPIIWAQVGEKHPGYDCFIFRREICRNFDLGNTCIGANWVGRVLLANIYTYSNNFEVFKDFHLTYHLGDDRSWKTPEYSDYDLHNQNELWRVLTSFKEKGLWKERALLEKFYNDILSTRGDMKDPTSKASHRRWWQLWGN